MDYSITQATVAIENHFVIANTQRSGNKDVMSGCANTHVIKHHTRRYPVSGHGDFGHPVIGHLSSDIWTLDTGIVDIYCQNGPWTSNTKFMPNHFGNTTVRDSFVIFLKRTAMTKFLLNLLSELS